MPPGLSDDLALEYGSAHPQSHPSGTSSRLSQKHTTTFQEETFLHQSPTRYSAAEVQGTLDKKRKMREIIDLSEDDNGNRGKGFNPNITNGSQHHRSGGGARPKLKNPRNQESHQNAPVKQDSGSMPNKGTERSHPSRSSQGRVSAQESSPTSENFTATILDNTTDESESEMRLSQLVSKKRSTSRVQVIVPQYSPPPSMPPNYEAVRWGVARPLSDEPTSSEDFGEASKSTNAHLNRRKGSCHPGLKRKENGKKRKAKAREIDDSEDEPDELAASEDASMGKFSRKKRPSTLSSSRKPTLEKERARHPQEAISATKCDVFAMFSDSKLLMHPGDHWVLCQFRSTGTVQFYDDKTQLRVPGMTIQAQDVEKIQRAPRVGKLIIHMKSGKGIREQTKIFLELKVAKKAMTITDLLLRHNFRIEQCTTKIGFMEKYFWKISSLLENEYFHDKHDAENKNRKPPWYSRTSMLSQRDHNNDHENDVDEQDIDEDVSMIYITSGHFTEDADKDDTTTENHTSQKHNSFDGIQARHKDIQEVYDTSAYGKSLSLRPRRGRANHNSFNKAAVNTQNLATPATQNRSTRSRRAHTSSRYSSDDTLSDDTLSDDTLSDDTDPSLTATQGWSRLNPGWSQQWRKTLSFQGKNNIRATVERDDIERLDDGVYLNDNLIDFYLRFLEQRLTQENPVAGSRVYFLNSFFYKKLSAKGRDIDYQAVERWTSKVDLVSYDYIFVPIHENSHWYLAIICNASKLLEPVSGSTSMGDSKRTPILHPPTSRHRREVNEVLDSQDPSGPSQIPLRPTSIPDSRQSDHDSPSASKTFKTVVSTPSSWALPPTRPSQTKSPPVDSVMSHRSLGRSSAAEITTESPVDLPRKASVLGRRVLNLTQPRILTLDSLGNRHSPTCTRLRDYLIAEIRAKKGIEIAHPGPLGLTVANLPQQQNNYDCGIFLLSYVEAFLKGPDDLFRKASKGEHLDIDMRDPAETRVLIRDIILKLQKEQK